VFRYERSLLQTGGFLGCFFVRDGLSGSGRGARRGQHRNCLQAHHATWQGVDTVSATDTLTHSRVMCEPRRVTPRDFRKAERHDVPAVVPSE